MPSADPPQADERRLRLTLALASMRHALATLDTTGPTIAAAMLARAIDLAQTELHARDAARKPPD